MGWQRGSCFYCEWCLRDEENLCPETGSAIGSRAVIREMLDFASREGIAARVQVRPLAEANAALDEVRRRQARYRIVLAV